MSAVCRCTHTAMRVAVRQLPQQLRALHLRDCDESLHPLRPHVLPSSLLYTVTQRLQPSPSPRRPPLAAGRAPPVQRLRSSPAPWCAALFPPQANSRSFIQPAATLESSESSIDSSPSPLQVGSLPERLLFLFFLERDPNFPLLLPLQPGVLPSTLIGIDFTDRCETPLPAGVIPLSVRWVRLWERYRNQHIAVVLPPDAECQWFHVYIV